MQTVVCISSFTGKYGYAIAEGERWELQNQRTDPEHDDSGDWYCVNESATKSAWLTDEEVKGHFAHAA
jgi:hypothetical protein